MSKNLSPECCTAHIPRLTPRFAKCSTFETSGNTNPQVSVNIVSRMFILEPGGQTIETSPDKQPLEYESTSGYMLAWSTSTVRNCDWWQREFFCLTLHFIGLQGLTLQGPPSPFWRGLGKDNTQSCCTRPPLKKTAIPAYYTACYSVTQCYTVLHSVSQCFI